MTDQPRMSALFAGDGPQGFLDFPVTGVEHAGDAALAVLGAPIATSYASVGAYCADAPAAIRAALGWPGVGEHHDFDTGDVVQRQRGRAVDCGDLACSETDFAANRTLIRDSVKTLLQGDTVPVVLGGDDSVPIPVLQAYENHAPLTVLQLDAHIDWRDEVQGEKFGLSSNMRRASEMPWVENIIQVGARGIGSARPRDRQDAVDWGVEFFPMSRLHEEGVACVRRAIPDDANLYIALDIDVMDPSIVPSVIGPAPGGMGYRDMITLLGQVVAHSRVVGVNLAELMPGRDVNGLGALTAARILATLCGLLLRRPPAG